MLAPDFLASERAIATDCFSGRPEFLSSDMFFDIVSLDLPVFNGISQSFQIALSVGASVVVGVFEAVSSTTSFAVPSVCTIVIE